MPLSYQIRAIAAGLITGLLLTGCLARLDHPYPPHWPDAADPSLGKSEPGDYLECTEAPLSPQQEKQLTNASTPLLVVPGVDNAPPEDRAAFGQSLGNVAGSDLVTYFNWYEDHFGRDILLAWTTDAAAERLALLIDQQWQVRPGRPLDCFAHSGGTVVVLKAARWLRERQSPARFGKVLFTGTPIADSATMAVLIERSDHLINAHSLFDQVNRRFSDADEGLDALPDSGSHRNLAFDRSLAGQIVRHQTFLQRDPELLLHWGAILSTGHPPQPLPPDAALAEADLATLHRHACWLARHEAPDPVALRQAIGELATAADPARRSYAATLATLTADRAAWPLLRPLLQDADAPPYLRRQVYRYLVALRDGRLMDVLRYCRKNDLANPVATRDALRDLKRAGIEPIRDVEP